MPLVVQVNPIALEFVATCIRLELTIVIPESDILGPHVASQKPVDLPGLLLVRRQVICLQLAAFLHRDRFQ